MRRILWIVLIGSGLLAAASPAMAQDRPAAEVFLGGSVLRDNSNSGGWNASVTGNLNSWLGVEADFSGHYHSPAHLYTYTFGPHVAVPADTGLVPFLHATFGAAHVGASGFKGANGFAAYIGGGMDWIAKPKIAVRLIQIDAALNRISGNNSSGTRLSFGVVFRLGNR
jgi:hypothetical protein